MRHDPDLYEEIPDDARKAIEKHEFEQKNLKRITRQRLLKKEHEALRDALPVETLDKIYQDLQGNINFKAVARRYRVPHSFLMFLYNGIRP